MEAEPRISVVIPHLNQGAALARCLAALSAQAGGVPVEVLVVDNGSAEPPAVAGPGVRLLHEAEPGPGPARNRGVAAARGAVVAFIDADCFPEPGWIAAIDRHFADPDAAAVVGGPVGIAFADPARPTAVEAYEQVFGYRIAEYIRREGFAGSGNLAVRAEVLRLVGPFAAIGLAEDRDWGRRASANGYPPAFLPGMRVVTPARASFAELARKWDRHVAHDFAELPGGAAARLGWCLRAVAVAGSPAFGAIAIARAEALPGARARAAAFGCLARIRLYRARRMLELALGRDPGALIGGWRG